jgi:hypothetical protein
MTEISYIELLRMAHEQLDSQSAMITKLEDSYTALSKANQQILNSALDSESNYCELRGSLPAHNLEQQAKGFDYASNKLTEQQGAAAAPILEMFNYFKNDLLSQAKALKEDKQ